MLTWFKCLLKTSQHQYWLTLLLLVWGVPVKACELNFFIFALIIKFYNYSFRLFR